MIVERVQFSIVYEGSDKYFENGVIGALDLHGSKSKISASSVGSSDSKLLAGGLKWTIPNKDRVGFGLQATKCVDGISLPLATAKSMSFTARVISPCTETTVKRDDVLIAIEDRPVFEAGDSYLVRVQNVSGRHLKASFVKLGQTRHELPSINFEKLSGWLERKHQTILTAAQFSRYSRVFLTPVLDAKTLSELASPDEKSEGFMSAFKKEVIPALKTTATRLFSKLKPDQFRSEDALYEELAARIFPKIEIIITEEITKGLEIWSRTKLEFRASILDELRIFLETYNYDPSDEALETFYLNKIVPKFVSEWGHDWWRMSVTPWKSAGADPVYLKRMQDCVSDEVCQLLGLPTFDR